MVGSSLMVYLIRQVVRIITSGALKRVLSMLYPKNREKKEKLVIKIQTKSININISKSSYYKLN